MSTVEIILLIVGVLCIAGSFFMPDTEKKRDEAEEKKRIKELIDMELKRAREEIDGMVEETSSYAVEKTERALEKLSNEKIMAVDEYSETVLKRINDNHNEAVFLYDMLNDKDEKIKNSTEELTKGKEEVKAELDRMEEERRKAEERRKLEEELKLKAEEERKAKEEAEKKASEKPFVPFVPERLVLENGVAVPVKSEEIEESKKPEEKVKKAKSTKASKPHEVEMSFDKENKGLKNSNERIKELHDEGKSNMAIAKELGLGIGEVKLVIDLYSSKK